MTKLDTFNVAKNVFVHYTALLNAVAQDIGTERALALQTMVTEKMGENTGQMIKEQMGIKELDVKTTSAVARKVVSGFGITSVDTEEKPTSVLFKVLQCPIYEAGTMLGMDDETKEVRCRNGPVKFMNAFFKAIDPKTSFHLRKFRAGADDFCEEEIML